MKILFFNLNIMASLGSSVNSSSLKSFLQNEGVSLNIIPKYIGAFEEDLGGSASRSDFESWAKNMCYEQGRGLTRSDSQKIYSLIS